MMNAQIIDFIRQMPGYSYLLKKKTTSIKSNLRLPPLPPLFRSRDPTPIKQWQDLRALYWGPTTNYCHGTRASLEHQISVNEDQKLERFERGIQNASRASFASRDFDYADDSQSFKNLTKESDCYSNLLMKIEASTSTVLVLVIFLSNDGCRW